MKIVLQGKSFNALYLQALKAVVNLRSSIETSRAGPVVNGGQAYFELQPNDPRLIFLNGRKINPVFAVIEAAWVLSGRNDLPTLAAEISNYREYSDDGAVLNGAYGHRLRQYFGKDQIQAAINELRNNPNSRRAVLTLYSPEDLGKSSQDIPCNTTVYLKIHGGALDITVLNRSNDLYRGVPYNVFVFGILQRYISIALGVPVGIQRHFTDSLHLYELDIPTALRIIERNNEDAVEEVSKQFSWTYADGVIENFSQITNGEYESIAAIDLKNFLTQYSREARAQVRQTRGKFQSSTNLFGFLAYQWIGPTEHEENKAWEKNRRSMMVPEIRRTFLDLANKPSTEIAATVEEMACRLSGKYGLLKEVLDRQRGPLGSRNFDGNEGLALKVLLLSLVETRHDPYLARTSIGARAQEELADACQRLGVEPSKIGPLSSVEDQLFDVLGTLLQ